MTQPPREATFMGQITAMSMHEMQNIMAIIRESAGLISDILKINAKVDFKHRANMEQTLEHITAHIARGKGLLEATSRLAHAPDDDLNASCNMEVYTQTLVLLAGRVLRLKGASLVLTPATQPLPIALGALPFLMLGYQALIWALGEQTDVGQIHISTQAGQEAHTLIITTSEKAQPDQGALSTLEALLPQGRLDWNGKELRIFFPVQR